MLKLKVQLLFTMPFAGRSLDFFSRFVLLFFDDADCASCCVAQKIITIKGLREVV